MFTIRTHFCVKKCISCIRTSLFDVRSSPLVCLGRMNLHTSFQCGNNKLMKMFANKKKKLWYETPPQSPPSSQIGYLKPPKKRNQEDNQRMRVLNSILYKAVTDLLGSHEVNAEVPGYNVEISKVSLPPDFSSCRIYWKASGTSERDVQIQQALDKSGPRIRYLLISQQILGSIPPVVFIRDKQYAALSEVENLLKTADFGPEEERSLTFNEKVGGASLHPAEPVERKRVVLFGVDHEALHKQIQEYRQRSEDATSDARAPAAGLTQQQLDTLAEIRKQKIIEKKKRKSSKRFKDDDITPKAYLQARHSGRDEGEGGERDAGEYSHEDAQSRELMAEDNRRL